MPRNLCVGVVVCANALVWLVLVLVLMLMLMPVPVLVPVRARCPPSTYAVQGTPMVRRKPRMGRPSLVKNQGPREFPKSSDLAE